jgi:hypothetical protein
MLNQRAQILLDHETKTLLQDAAAAMNVSFGEAIRHAANYTYKTKKHHLKTSKTPSRLLSELASIHKTMKPLHLTIEQIKEMAHHGHKY